MSRHEGVSCDSCLKEGFTGHRYKCLICYDYDLCAKCYESQAVSSQHSKDHAMQCILSKVDTTLFYRGESEQTHIRSYTCPFCANPGYTEATLVDHVSSQHNDGSAEVVCPICASLPGGDPNHVTSDFSAHLTLEHRPSNNHGGGTGNPSSGGGPSELLSFFMENRSSEFAGPSFSARKTASSYREPGYARISARPKSSMTDYTGTRGTNTNLKHIGNRIRGSSIQTLMPSVTSSLPTELSDTELELNEDSLRLILSELSGVRRSASSSSSSSQLQQLQMQLQLASTQQAHARQEHGLSRVNATRNPTRSGFSASSAAAAAAAAAAAGMPSVIGPSSSGSGMHVITGTSGSSSAIPVLGGVTSAGNSAHHIGHTHQHILGGDRGIHGNPHPLQSVSGLSGASDSSSSVSSLGASAFNFGVFGGNGATSTTQLGSGVLSSGSSAFLLRQLSDEESGDDASKAEAELAKAKKSHFVQELVLSTLMREHMHLKPSTMYQKREPGGQHSSTIFVETRDEYDDIYDKGDKESITSDSDSS